ncbi:MAG: SRPBCC family protein [Burkholderiales bacterium]
MACAALSVLPTFAASAAPATSTDAEPSLRVEVVREHGVFQISATFSVGADIATVWAVLTDYDHLAEFVPDLEASRVVSAAGEPLRVAQRGRAGFAFVHFDIDVVLAVEATPMESLRFQEAGGSLRRMQGEWRLVPAPAGVSVHYSAQIEPGFWVPPLIGSALVRRDVRRQLAALAAEMHKRHGAAAASGAAPPAARPDR